MASLDMRLRTLEDDRDRGYVDPITRLTLLRRGGVAGIEEAVSGAQKLVDAVYGACRGDYQRALLDGRETWSGSSLKGKAAKYGSHYARSRAGLLARIQVSVGVLGYAAQTAIDATRHGKRRLQVRVGEAWIDWEDVSQEELALAIYDAGRKA